MLSEQRSEAEALENKLAEKLSAARLAAAELEEQLSEAKRQLRESVAEAKELREYAQNSAESLLEAKDEIAELKVVILQSVLGREHQDPLVLCLALNSSRANIRHSLCTWPPIGGIHEGES